MPSRDAGSSALRYVVVDVFTEKPLEGNQLGVFLDARSLSSEQMQRLAREMNFAESVFVLPPGNGADARIRIFPKRQKILISSSCFQPISSRRKRTTELKPCYCARDP